MRDHLANAPRKGRICHYPSGTGTRAWKLRAVASRGTPVKCENKILTQWRLISGTLSSPLSFIFTTSDPCSGGSENGHNGLAWCWHISREGGTDSVGKAQAFYSR